MSLLIRNGRVALGDRLEALDVRVGGTRVEALGAPGSLTADRILDAQGAFVLPGLIDFHTHLDDRIGAHDLADTIEMGSRVAVLNGITTLCTFVTQGHHENLGQALNRARCKALGRAHTDLWYHLTPTRFEAGDRAEQQRLLGLGYRTWKFYTTYRPAGLFQDWSDLEARFRELGPGGARFLLHCEADDLIPGEAPVGLDLSRASAHGRLRSEAAEVEAIRSAIGLSRDHQVPLHVVHVSTVEGARLVQAALASGLLSAETCPQYLWLDETWLDRPDGHRWLCSPPLRGDRERFRNLAREGAFTLLATDHCAFRPEDKDAWNGRDIRTVANGLAGIGALPHLAWQLWQSDPEQAALQVAHHLSAEPARLLGLKDRKGRIAPGCDADLVLIDPKGPERPIRSSLSPTHEPYPGFSSPLAFPAVIRGGELCVEAGTLIDHEPHGRLLQPEP